MQVPVAKDMLQFITMIVLILLAAVGLPAGEAKGGFVMPTTGSYILLVCLVWMLSFLFSAMFMRPHR